MRTVDFPHRVTYAETDKMGFVYYGNYLTYFEIGRTEFIRAAGKAYIELEEQGFFLPVVEASCRYHRPGRYDDMLIIRTTLASFKGVRMEFTYEIRRGVELIAGGRTLHAFMDAAGKPKKPSVEIREMMEKFLGE